MTMGDMFRQFMLVVDGELGHEQISEITAALRKVKGIVEVDVGEPQHGEAVDGLFFYPRKRELR